MNESAENNPATKISALIVATSSSFLTPLMVSSINIALPAIEKEFKPDAVLLSWVATSYLLAAAIFLVPFGKLGDIYGMKKTFLYGMILFTVSSFLSAVSTSVPMLIFFRISQGCGGAMIFANRIAILTSIFPPGERGRVLGINVAAVYTGLSVGPFLGGFLTQYFTWRSVFLVTIPLGVIVVFLILFKLKGEWAGAKGEKFDVTGSIIYSLTLIGILYGVTLLPASSGLGLILFGLLGLAAFIKWETAIPYPVFEVNLFKTNRVFAFSCLAALINYSATFAVTFLLSLYLQYIKGLSPQATGAILIAQPVVMALFSPFTGKLSDRIEPRILASWGMVLTAVGLILLSFINRNTTVGFIVACLLFLGFGFALFSSPNMNAIMSSVEKRFYGIASGSVGTMRVLGQVFSMGIATLIFSLLIGRVRITPEHYPAFIKSVKIAFVIFSTLCAGGIFLSLARGKLRPQEAGQR